MMDGLRALSTVIFQWTPFSRDALELSSPAPVLMVPSCPSASRGCLH